VDGGKIRTVPKHYGHRVGPIVDRLLSGQSINKKAIGYDKEIERQRHQVFSKTVESLFALYGQRLDQQVPITTNKNRVMIGGAALLLMQHLMSSSGPSSYYGNSASTIQESRNQSQPNETVMFIELDELQLDGTTEVKRINLAYVKYMESCKFSILDMGTFKETGERVDATRITMFDDSYLFVSDSMHDLGFRLQIA
jgi:hypothetical protein